MTGGGRGIGLTVNVYRPGGVDAAMQAWIRDQNPEQVVTALHQQFVHSYQHGTLLAPSQSAASPLRSAKSRQRPDLERQRLARRTLTGFIARVQRLDQSGT